MCDHFLDGVSSGDWISSGILLTAAITLLFSARAFRLQARAMDFSSYLDLMTRYSDAWRRFGSAKTSGERDYEFRELLNLFEAGCHLWRHGILGRASEEMLEEYLRENIAAIIENDYGKSHLSRAISGPKTFSEMKLFAQANNLHWS